MNKIIAIIFAMIGVILLVMLLFFINSNYPTISLIIVILDVIACIGFVGFFFYILFREIGAT